MEDRRVAKRCPAFSPTSSGSRDMGRGLRLDRLIVDEAHGDNNVRVTSQILWVHRSEVGGPAI